MSDAAGPRRRPAAPPDRPYAHSPTPGVLVLEPAGELDLRDAADLRRAFDRIVDEVPNPVVLVELGQVSFLGSAGVAVLLDIAGDAEARGGRIALVGPGPAARRVLELLGLQRVLPVYPSDDEALGPAG